MSVDVTKTSGGSATITWSPREDDPRGYLTRAVESGQLEDALAALGATTVEGLGSPERMRQIAGSTARLAAELERRTRHLAVILRRDGLSWAELADTLYDDPSMRSTARRAYEAGMRQLGLAIPSDES